ncbi:hypothetical protein [Pyrodictium abyssi]|uniref:Uncharacterized protein n=1 Tax=Pyrodictium abyssi TaxID=54256 RepID=A0ABM8IU69_9CREN|nr:hypothetical protein PABY_06360 [Pyrodictium abyssi]
MPACEAAARAWKQETRHPWLRELATRIRGSRARGYRRFLLQYFHAMERHLSLLAERLEWQARGAIGDSILGGAYIPVHRGPRGASQGARPGGGDETARREVPAGQEALPT